MRDGGREGGREGRKGGGRGGRDRRREGQKEKRSERGGGRGEGGVGYSHALSGHSAAGALGKAVLRRTQVVHSYIDLTKYHDNDGVKHRATQGICDCARGN